MGLFDEDPLGYCFGVTEDEYFDLVIHHGGIFTEHPSLSYVGGRVEKVNKLDPDRFCSIGVRQLVDSLNYSSYSALWWKVPGQPLDVGRRALVGDDDIRQLIAAVKGHNYVEIFVEHPVDSPVVLQPTLIEGVQPTEEDEVVDLTAPEVLTSDRGESVASEEARFETTGGAEGVANEGVNDCKGDEVVDIVVEYVIAEGEDEVAGEDKVASENEEDNEDTEDDFKEMDCDEGWDWGSILRKTIVDAIDT